MPELHVRDAGVGGDRARVVELEHGPLRARGGHADGHLGEEEGGEVQEGVWGQVSEEAVQHVAWDLVGAVSEERGGAREEGAARGTMCRDTPLLTIWVLRGRIRIQQHL